MGLVEPGIVFRLEGIHREELMAELTRSERKKKAEELNNSRPLDVGRVSDHPEVKAALEQIFLEMQDRGLTNRRYEKKLKNHIRAIVLDLYSAHEFDPKMYVSYSRNPNKYGKKSRYHALFLGYRNTMKVIKFLIEQGYVENVGGMQNTRNPERSRQSRMRATSKMIDMMEDSHKVILSMIEQDVKNEDEDVIVLRDENKEDIKYTDSDETRRMRDNLKLINKNLEKHSILLYLKDKDLDALRRRLRRSYEKRWIDFTQKRLRRIFNVSFTRGGRFYGGWWQNIPREHRKYIRINDKDTVELDCLFRRWRTVLPKEAEQLSERWRTGVRVMANSRSEATLF